VAHNRGYAERAQGADDGAGAVADAGASADAGRQLRCVGYTVFVLRLHADIHAEKGKLAQTLQHSAS
jgi:hypothetical protein